ncbi:MAG: hypothetical protein ACI84C_000644 [Flavobacteriales bacterium]|jgi:hypothetical protein
MKRIIFLVPVLLCLIAKGQNEQTFINALWHSTSQVNELVSLNSIQAANLSGFTLNASNYELDEDFVYRLEYQNNQGDIIWQTSANEPEIGQCTHSVLLDNGWSLIAGYLPYSVDLSIQKASLHLIDEWGQENWSEIDLADETSSSVTSSVRLASDSTIWHSSVSWSIDEGPISRLQHLTLGGDLLWSISLEGLIVDIQTAGSNARVLKWNQDGMNWYGSLLKVNSSGEFLGEVGLDQSIETPESFCAFEQDSAGNLIVVCKNSMLGNTSIVVWSLSDSFELNWTNTYHVPGTDLSPQAVAIDNSGDIFVCGKAKENNEPEKMLLCHIQTDGVLISLFTHAHAEGIDQELVSLQSHDDQQVAHLLSSDGESSLLGLQGNGIEWSQKIGDGILPESLGLLSTGGRLFQSWTDSEGIIHRESLLLHTLTNTLAAEGDYIENQLVVKFDPSVIDLAFVENTEVRFGRLHQVVGQAMVEQLSAICGVDLGQKCTAVKIFPGFAPSLPNSINRNGREIANPDFWACFRLDFSEDINEVLIAELLENSAAIRYCEVNPVIHQMNEPNDPLFELQTSLGTTGEIEPNGNIKGMNLEGAWDHYSGSPDIKIGIFDDIIFWGHEDFGDGTLSGSVVKGGYDFVNGQDLDLANEPEGSHGTATAGIIGAKRNNEIGISGIAGGDIGEGEEGVSLYSMGIFSGNVFVSELSTATQAIVEGSYENPDSEYGYGLHIQNHSWGTWIDSQILEEAVTYAWRNNSVFIAARGNSGDEVALYPACYEDERVINVGACDEVGDLQENVGGNADSSFGLDADILAPGSQAHIWAPIYPNELFGLNYETTSDNQYSTFNNTSSATAHVSGAAALAYQSCLDNTISPINPYTEDVEMMIQFSGRDLTNESTTSYDYENAWGWLDSHQLVSSLVSPFGFIHHFDLDQQVLENTISGASLQLGENFEDMEAGSYFGELLQFSSDESFNIPFGFELVQHWPISSATLGLINAEVYNGNPFESEFTLSQQGSLVSIHSTLQTFHVLSDSEGNLIDEWVPAQPSELIATYSGYFTNPEATLLNEIGETSTIKVYPNPCVNEIKIVWPGEDIYSVRIYDPMGKTLQDAKAGMGSESIILNVESLTPGVYSLEAKGLNSHITTTIIKVQ